MRKTPSIFAALLLLVVLGFTTIYGQIFSVPGTWDRSFGRDGVVQTPVPVGLPYNIQHLVNDLVVQPDGKIIAAGQYSEYSQTHHLVSFMLVRYNPNGSLDASFGEDGVSAVLPGVTESVRSIALQPDGKIVAAGIGGTSDLALARYNPDGSLDPSFGLGGVVIEDLTGFEEISFDSAQKVLVLPDGRLLVIGSKSFKPFPGLPGDFYKGSIFVGFYNPDGTPDSSHHPGGKVFSAPDLRFYSIRSAVITSDGGLMVTVFGDGLKHPENPTSMDMRYEGLMIKYKPDGSIDTEFGENGVLTEHGLHSYKILKALPNGDLIAARTHKLLLLNENGQLLSEIVSGEDTFIEGQAFWPEDYVLQPDGKILSLGKLPDGSYYHQRGIVRFLSSGKIDKSFGYNGVSPALPQEIDDRGELLRLQPDGKIIYGGSTLQSPQSPNRIILARLNGDPPLNRKDLKH
jgi:uncharacterized delta-60 repeat protein